MLHDLADEVGESSARLPRDIIVERGVAQNLRRDALDFAITLYVIEGILKEEDGIIQHIRGKIRWALPSQQQTGIGPQYRVKRVHKWLKTAYPIVSDIIVRRTDGRAPASNPLDAFEHTLAKLGHERFCAWWVQKRHELRLLDTELQPVAVTVLASALGEAALAFVVPRAQRVGLMKRVEVAKPRQWKFADLVQGAKSSDPTVKAILDERTAQRCLDLNEARQRIHAGFLIDTVPSGSIPDLKPEQARDAVQSVDLLVRKILDWLTAQERQT